MSLFTVISCGQRPNTSELDEIPEIIKTEYKIQTFEYDSLTIPDFFIALIENHLTDFYKIDSVSYNEFCENNNLVSADTQNINKYFTIKILHDLFTSQTASNCSKGEILYIPYLWHWTSPNPRHELYFVETRKLLSKTKPPQEFSKYNTYADIDRTPYLFLSDLVKETLGYYSASCDTFSTFGWCSEREMAFVALTHLLNFNGKIVAEGNHSWSEFVITMKSMNSEFHYYKVKVDNTFNSLDWSLIKKEEIPDWKIHFGNSSHANWYNKKAKSQSELLRISNHIVGKNAMKRIEIKIVEYLTTKINAR